MVSNTIETVDISEIGPMKQLIGFVFVILFSIIMIVKVLVFNTLQKKTIGSEYQVIIGGSLIAVLLLVFSSLY